MQAIEKETLRESAFLQPFDQILKKLFSVPVMVLIVGDWKTGKTDFALLIAERLLELGIVKKVASNIETKDPRIEFISSLERLRYWLYSDKTRKLYVLDEAGVHFPRRTPMKEKNVQAIQLLPEISKAHARLIVVAQDPDTIDSQFLNPTWLKALFVKDSLKFARLISDMFETVITLRDIPPTTIKFDPYAIAPFTLKEPQRIPEWVLRDDQYKLLWGWAIEGKSLRALGVHPMQLNRIVRKFVANILKSTDLSPFTQQREVSNTY
jgi:archaellum biogenesis ATPase FlaH